MSIFKPIFFSTILIVAGSPSALSEVVEIPSEPLRRALVQAIPGSEITKEKLALLRALNVTGYPRACSDDDDCDRWVDIYSLEGLQYAINLESLSVGKREEVSNLGPIKGLTKLKSLKIPSNRIEDLSPLEDLVDLEHLDLSRNAIENLGPISELRSLKELDISQNPIADLSPLHQMTALTNLDIEDSGIYDIGPIEQLKDLQTLDLDGNQIADITPLQALTSLRHLDLDMNYISDIRPLRELRHLEELDLDNNWVANIQPLSSLSRLRVLDLSVNEISDTRHLLNLRALEEVELSANPLDSSNAASNHEVMASLSASGVEVQIEEDTIEHIISSRRVRDSLQGRDRARRGPLTLQQLKDSEWFSYSGRGDQLDLTILHHIPKLRGISLSNFTLGDLSPIAEFQTLEHLSLFNCNINDYSPLANLSMLKSFRISREGLDTFELVANLDKLKYLKILPGTGSERPILNLRHIPILPALEDLDLSEFVIEGDFSIIQQLKNLKTLSLRNCGISDEAVIVPLLNHQSLTSVNLRDNNIMDVGGIVQAERSPQANSLIVRLPGNPIDFSDPEVKQDVMALNDQKILLHNTLFGARFESPLSPVTEGRLIPQDELRRHVYWAVEWRSNVDPPPEALSSLVELEINYQWFNDLDGLEHAFNLRKLVARWNRLEDISALASLTSLRRLQLDENTISDLSPLKALHSLDHLDLDNNKIEFVDSLESLSALTFLDLAKNKINDISPLAGLSSLELLDLDGNELNDIEPLRSLKRLRDLDLHDNGLTEIEALLDIPTLESVRLMGNPLNIGAGSRASKVIEVLWSRGVRLDLAAPTDLLVERDEHIIRFSWKSVSGPLYELQSSRDLQQWVGEGPPIFHGTGRPLSYERAWNRDDTGKYFRIRMRPRS